MAGCDYFIGNKKYSEQEFKDFLIKDGLKSFIEDKSINLSKIKINKYVQEPSTGSVLQHPQEGTRGQGGESGRMESSIKGENTSKENISKNKANGNEKEPPIVPPSEADVEGDNISSKMRAVYKNLIERSTSLTKEQKSLLSNDPNALYNVLPIEQSKKIASEMINAIGVDKAVLEAKRSNSSLSPVERVTILGAAMDYYSGLSKEQAKKGKGILSNELADKEIDAQAEMLKAASELGTIGTAYGRAINMIKEVYKLSNIALTRKLEKQVEDLNKLRSPEADVKVKEISKIISEEKESSKNAASDMTEAEFKREEDYARKVDDLQKEVDNLKKEILKRDEAQKGTKKNPLKIKRITNDTEYDKRLKDFQQRQRSIMSKDDVVDLTYFGLYHIENGVSKFADWYNIMSKKFNGFKDHLQDIYRNSRDKAIENGADVSLFDSDNGVKDFFNKTKEEKIQSIKDLLVDQIEEVRQQIIDKNQTQKEENKKQQKDLETERLEEQLADLVELRDKYIPELPEKYDFDKKREKVKDRLVKSIIDLNEQINVGEKTKKESSEKYEGDSELNSLKKIKEQKQKLLDKITGLSEEEKKELSDARKMVLKTKKVAIAKFKEAMDNNPDRARVQAPRMAAERIRKDAERNLDMPSTKVEQTYLKKLVQTINQKAKEYYKEKKENVKNINDILAFAIANNKSDYKIWDRTKEELHKNIDSDTSLTTEQKAEVKDFLQDYTDSVFDTLLTKTQVDQIIREKLIGAGHVIEKTVNGKVVKAVDWNSIIGKAKNIQDAKEQIVKAINELGFTEKEAKGEISAILDQFDASVADRKTKEINAYLNKGLINKVKSALGSKPSKSQIQKLIDMNNKGMFSDDRVKDVLAKELGIETISKEELAHIRELSDLIDNPNIPSFKRREFEEKLQYIFDSKGGNINYLENRESVMANRLSSPYNQAQNITGFTRVISTFITNALKTKKPIDAAKVFGKELSSALAEAKSILIKGAVSRGTSFSDLTRSTEGEPRVRYLEQSKGKYGGGTFLGKPIYAKIGNKTIDINPINAAYSKVKYIPRSLEAVDSFSSGASSGLTQFHQISKQIDKYYPELSSKEKSSKVWDIMYSLDRTKERPLAIKSLKEAGVENPDEYEINRTINEKVERERNKKLSEEFYKQVESIKPLAETKLKTLGNESPSKEEIQEEAFNMLGESEPLDVVARGERQAARETGKSTTFGLTSMLLTVPDAIQKKISTELKGNNSQAGKVISNSADATFSLLFPFVHSIGRWVEMKLELTPYGFVKGAVYKTGLARAIDGVKGEKIPKQEYSEMADDYMMRSVLGASYTIGLLYAFGLAKQIAGDDDKVEDAITGTFQKENYGQERVQSAGNPKQTVKVGGHNIPLQLLGASGIVLGMYSDYLKYRKEKEYEEKSILYISGLIALNTTIEETWGSSASKYGGAASAMKKGKEENWIPTVGRLAGQMIGSQIPFNRAQVEVATVLDPQSKKSTDFGVNLQNQLSIFRLFTDSKPSFDFRGRTYDYGDIYANSADGVNKMFGKAKYGDKADEFLSNINFAATDAYRETKDEETNKYAITNSDGTKRAMTLDEYYDFKYKTGKLFDSLIKPNYEKIDKLSIDVDGKEDKLETMKFKKDIASKMLLYAKNEAFNEIQEKTGFTPPKFDREKLIKDSKIDSQKIKKEFQTLGIDLYKKLD